MTVLGSVPAGAQAPHAPASGIRETIQGLHFEPLRFEQPEPERHTLDGVRVVHLEDRSLPLVTFIVTFRGGYGFFGREDYAAAMGLPALLRYGGTEALPPDSVDGRLDFYAIQTSFASGGGGISSTMNTLTEHLQEAMRLWGSMLAEPRFDESEIEVWRARELDGARRRREDPAGLAYAEFNHLLYGDHSIGWQLGPEDLAPERIRRERFQEVHRKIVCRTNLLLGVTGDLAWEEAEPLLRSLLDALPPCEARLPSPPDPEVHPKPGIFLIERPIDQAVVVMAHPTGLRLSEDPEYFAATLGNSILGDGGFSSRLLERVRTEEGYAYAASSLWTTPRRYDGVLGAVTRTAPANVVPVIEVIQETFLEMRETEPSTEEVRAALDRIVNGFVFNFENPAEIVSRTMYYMGIGLPDDWLERYLGHVQEVTPEAIQGVFARHLRLEEMTILVVGDPERIGRTELSALGPLTVLDRR